MPYRDILEEWEGGAFPTTKTLSEAFTTLLSLLPQHDLLPDDERLLPFLEDGYRATLDVMRHTKQANPLIHLLYKLAKHMVTSAIARNQRTASAPVHPSPTVTATAGASTSGCQGPRHDVHEPVQPTKRTCEESEEEGREEEGREEGEEEAVAEEVPPTIEILESTTRHLNRFKMDFREEVFVIKHVGTPQNLHGHLADMFDTLLARQRQEVNAQDGDDCIVEVRGEDDAHRPIWFSLRKTQMMSGGVILDKISQVLNSNESFLTCGKLFISYIHIPQPRDGGKSNDRIDNEDFTHFIQRKLTSYSLFDPKNTLDNMCLTRCVAVAIARGSVSKFAFSRLKNPRSVIQKQMSLQLCENAQIDPQQKCGIQEVKQLQNSLDDHRIVLFCDQYGKEIVYHGPKSTPTHPRKNIYLLLHEEHFYAVFLPSAVFQCNYFCENCLTPYSNKNSHKCPGACWRCGSPENHDDKNNTLTQCKDCCRFFAGNVCFQFHKTEKIYTLDRTTCDTKKYCPKCQKSYEFHSRGRGKLSSHKCGYIRCTKCNLDVPENHLCYIPPWEPKPLSKNTRYIRVYFDIETTTAATVQDRNNWMEHKANVLISQQVCCECEHVTTSEHLCANCGEREQIFDDFSETSDNSVVSQFLTYLLSLCSEQKTQIQCFSHNGRAFDSIFILQEFIRRKMKPELILQGAKIICLKYENITFKDSLLFVMQKLRNLPKAFNLTELRKGFFPFLMNRPEYFSYSGPMPDKELYHTSSMKADEKEEFETWYQQQVDENYIFNFKYEITTYCQSDTDLLRQALEVYRVSFIEVAGFDPLHHCITLSSACMAMFRYKHLQPYTIGLVPRGGYRRADLQSKIALKWLSYEQSLLGNTARILTAENGREVKVMGRPVDGYTEIHHADGATDKIIWAFHGCWWHQCRECYPDQDTRTKLIKQKGEDAYEKTKRITDMFRRNHYIVKEMWECAFLHELQNNIQMKQFFENNPVIENPILNMRDTLCGGRTSALRSYKKADISKGERIKFFDICSEYPFANFKSPYVYGHPKVYLEGDAAMPAIEDWNGAALVKILPPVNLFLPVLGIKSCSKLLFPLCRSCAETQNQEACDHDDPEDRVLTGSWCANELQLAVKKGYKIVKVYELHQYPGTKVYDHKTKTDGLFSAYVRENMALKYEASGWPSHIQSDAEKDQYVKEIFDRDGIVIRKDKVEKNPGKRFLAKLVLNSFWGKMGERTLRPQTEIVYDYGQLIRLTQNSSITIDSILPLSEDCLQVNYTPKKEMDECFKTTSLIHAAQTTAHGRLLLYKYLDIVGERALYHDTDSVCFLSVPGQPEPELGQYLGDMTDQLQDDFGPGSYCCEFVSAGAKNYAFKVMIGGDPKNIQTVIKVRGISINSSCDNVVTFETLKDMVLSDEHKVTTVNIPSQIARIPGWRIVTRPTTKKWQVCLNKRRRIDKERTVPFGFRDNILDDDDYETLNILDDLWDA